MTMPFPSRTTSARRWLALALTTAVAALSWAGAPATATPAAATTTAPLLTETVPDAMDSSNVAGWWTPLALHGNDRYLAYNAPAEEEDRHEVHLARQASDGTWTSACLEDAAGACETHLDDPGHNQPSLAVDGNGQIHAFVSMHNSPWQYFRSDVAGDVTSMVDRSSQLPDQNTTFTYPVLATAPNGDVYLMARVGPASSYSARLYRYELATGQWTRVAIFAQEAGWTPYPDDLAVDDDGTVHILWEWADGGAGPLRYSGSYLTYRPADGVFRTIAGQPVTLPVTRSTTGMVYEPGDGVVQSARFALVNGTGNKLIGVAYRYQPTGSTTFDIRWARWDGTAWQNETIASGFSSPAAIAATHDERRVRVYYVRTATCDERDLREQGGLFVAEKLLSPEPMPDTDAWQETWLGGGAGVERFAAESDSNGDDVLYLASPRVGDPVNDPQLRIAKYPREGDLARKSRATGGATPTAPADGGPTNLAYGATVTTSTTLNDVAIGACATDGDHWSSTSRWISAATDPSPTMTIDLGDPMTVGEVQVYSGYAGGAVAAAFTVEAKVDGTWQQVAAVSGNVLNPRTVVLASPVQASQLRLVFPAGTVRIYEVVVHAEQTVPSVGVVPITAAPGFLQYPGSASIVRSTLVNLTGATVQGTASLQVPAGWTVLPTQTSYNLAPGEELALQFRVTSPATAAVGDHHLTLSVSPYGEVGELTLPVRGGVLYPSDGPGVYAETGAWNSSSLLGPDGSATRWAYGGSGGTATWTPKIPEAGQYRVAVWVPVGDNTTAAEYVVTHAGGSATIVVDQSAVAGAWHELGTWDFAVGSAGNLSLVASGPGYHRAGAVRFERV